MRSVLSHIRAGWRSLETKDEVPFSPLIAAMMIVYTVTACLVWYAIRHTPNERWLASIGIDRHRSVLILVWLGTFVFFGLLWRFRNRPPWSLKPETLLVIFLSLTALTLFWLYGRRVSYTIWFGQRPPWGGHQGLIPYYFFVTNSVMVRVVLPIIVMWLVFKRGLKDYGFQVKGAFKLWWLYGILVVIVMLIVIFYASTLPAFLKKYPWCKQGIVGKTIASDVLLVYTLGTAIFFSSVEAFWRGYFLFGTAKELGRLALFFVAMPYVLGHCGKPLPETLGAIAAGLGLGGLALYHRSFWLGAISHFVIAITMDLMALWRRGITIVW